MATLIGLAVARHHLAGVDVRADGIRARPCAGRLRLGRAHGSVARAFEILGLGRKALRLIPVDGDYRIELDALRADRAGPRRGRAAFLVVGTAGTVNTGAIDDLAGLTSARRRASGCTSTAHSAR